MLKKNNIKKCHCLLLRSLDQGDITEIKGSIPFHSPSVRTHWIQASTCLGRFGYSLENRRGEN